MLFIILQEPHGFEEHDFSLPRYIEFLPMYHIYPSSLPCIVISIKFVSLTRLYFSHFLLKKFKKADAVLDTFMLNSKSVFNKKPRTVIIISANSSFSPFKSVGWTPSGSKIFFQLILLICSIPLLQTLQLEIDPLEIPIRKHSAAGSSPSSSQWTWEQKKEIILPLLLQPSLAQGLVICWSYHSPNPSTCLIFKRSMQLQITSQITSDS